MASSASFENSKSPVEWSEDVHNSRSNLSASHANTPAHGRASGSPIRSWFSWLMPKSGFHEPNRRKTSDSQRETVHAESMSDVTSPTRNRLVGWSIVLLIAGYVGSLTYGLPQLGREKVVEGLAHSAEHVEAESHSAADAEHESESMAPPLFTVAPFVVLLLCIAVLPLIPATHHWWESNLHRFYVAGGLGLITLAYFLFWHHAPVDGHWPAHHVVHASDGVIQWEFAWTIFANAMLSEFVPFIVLLFSLYTISGGIRIEGDLRANPLTNAAFMAVGGALASFIGTTGAAMLLIRPLLETNQERKHVKHTVIFFIFIVCNCGGCLLPIGDPPLFLGYLRGVPFMWTFELVGPWLLVNGLLLLVYCLLDQLVYYPRETVADIQRDIKETRRLRISGWQVNVPLLLGVVLAVALLDPGKAVPGTDWHAWLFLREIVQLGLVAASLLICRAAVRQANRFNFLAIVEVAALFCGIFICMQPALQILNEKGDELGINTQAEFFWITGGLSSVLDNAPTYVVFFETAKVETKKQTTDGAAHEQEIVPGANVFEPMLIAISLGAVFMGAMTYIGNGPNFMVKAIAEKSGVRMPSFFGYIGYSAVYLLPILLVVHWRYLSG